MLESLFANETTTFEGRYYVLRDAMNNPKPVQAKLPVCIGGSGRRRTLPLTARFADHWNYGGTDPAEFGELRGVLHRACDDIGRDPSTITTSFLLRWSGEADQLLSDRDAFAAQGADLAIVSVPKQVDPSAVDELAEILG